jgi:hypothetical protein
VHGLPKTRNDEKQGFVMTQIFPNRIVDEFPIFSMNFLAGRLKHESPQPEAYPARVRARKKDPVVAKVIKRANLKNAPKFQTRARHSTQPEPRNTLNVRMHKCKCSDVYLSERLEAVHEKVAGTDMNRSL